jgi:hypothetical protein
MRAAMAQMSTPAMAKSHAIQRLAGVMRDAREIASSSGRLMTRSPHAPDDLFDTR